MAPFPLTLRLAIFWCNRYRRVGRKFKPSRICLHGADVSAHGSSRRRRYWIYRWVRGSASVAFCSALGRRNPQSKTCSKARAQTSQKEGRGRIGLAIFLCRSPLKILVITLELLQSRSKAIEDGLRRLGPNSALVMYISTEMDP